MDKRTPHTLPAVTLMLTISIASLLTIPIAHSQSTYENASNFTITGQLFQNTTITITNCQNFTVHNNTFTNATLKIDITPGNTSQNFKIYNNTFLNNSFLIIFGSPSERGIREFTIYNNTLRNSVKLAIAFAANATITDNHITNCQHGIATRDVTNITIQTNTIENCLEYGIYLGTQPADQGTTNLTIKNNQITNATNGIGRNYGNEPIKNMRIDENQFINCTNADIDADFPALFYNNTVTVKSKIKLTSTGAFFQKNKDIQGGYVQPGDISGDGKIDMRDIAVVCRHFGEQNNTELDVIQDGKIDMMDISFLCKHYGIAP